VCNWTDDELLLPLQVRIRGKFTVIKAVPAASRRSKFMQ
jgi:hypothetical protein